MKTAIRDEGDSSFSLEVRIEDETVWLNRSQIAALFDRDVKTIGKHINNALKEELQGLPTVANFATVQIEGNLIKEAKERIILIDNYIDHTVLTQLDNRGDG